MSDADLQRALRRREPPAGFSSRVRDRVHAAQQQEAGADAEAPMPPRTRVRAWIAAGVAVAASVVIATGVAREEAQRREAAGQRAAQDLETALQIAGEALQHVQIKVTHTGEQR